MRVAYAILGLALCVQIPVLRGVSDKFQTEVHRLEESNEALIDQAPDQAPPPVEGSLSGGSPVPPPEPQPSNPNTAPQTTEGQNQEGGVASGTPSPPVNGGGSEGAEIVRKPPPPSVPDPIQQAPPPPPASRDEYHHQVDFHQKTREADQQTQDANQAASVDHGPSDPGDRFAGSQGGGGAPASPEQTPEDQAKADADQMAPADTPPDPDASPPADPQTVAAWNRASGSAYSGDRNAPPEVMAPTDGRVNVVNIDKNNKRHPYVNSREYPYPQAEQNITDVQNYIYQTSLAHDADTWKPVYNGLPDPHEASTNQMLNGANGLEVFTPTYKDAHGQNAASEPIVDPNRPNMRQYVAPALRPDVERPAEPSIETIPSDVLANITKESEEWLIEQEKDIDENPAANNTTPEKWHEIAEKSKVAYAKAAEQRIKERGRKWQKEVQTKQANTQERAKKMSLLKDMEARSADERVQKDNITKIERAAKELTRVDNQERTSKERVQKPSEAQQKTIDETKYNATVKEGEEKYKQYDIVQEVAEKAEEKRIADEKKERAVKHEQLEKEANPGQSLAETMGDEEHLFMDVLAKDAMLASLRDGKNNDRASKEEQRVAVVLEERAQEAQLPHLKPAAMAETGINGIESRLRLSDEDSTRDYEGSVELIE